MWRERLRYGDREGGRDRDGDGDRAKVEDRDTEGDRDGQRKIEIGRLLQHQ